MKWTWLRTPGRTPLDCSEEAEAEDRWRGTTAKAGMLAGFRKKAGEALMNALLIGNIVLKIVQILWK